jgi:hypothetical protein
LNVALHHAIFFKRPVVFSTVLKGENTGSVFEILLPISFIFASVRVVEGSLSVAEA